MASLMNDSETLQAEDQQDWDLGSGDPNAVVPI
jgi:hypothetical protein